MFKKVRKGLLIIVTLLFLIYIGGAIFFSQYYQPNTYINGKNFSFIKKSDLVKEYNGHWKDFELTIKGRDNKADTLKASDIDYIAQIPEDTIVSQESYYWFITSFFSKNNTVKNNTEYDNQKLDEAIQQMHIVKDSDIKDPEPATIDYEEGKGYVVKPHTEGTRVDIAKLKQSILKSLGNKEEFLDLEAADVYKKPGGEDEEYLARKAESLNEIDSFTLTYDFSDRKEVLQGQSLIDLYREEEDGSLVPDNEKINNYVKKLSEKYDTFGSTRDFEMTGGGTARVPGGIYGWKTDQKATANELLKAIKAQETKVLKPVYEMEARSRNVNDIGDTYIEIDIARQHMWLYKGGELVTESPVVTGDSLRGNGTPTGTGYVWSKEQDRYLKGETWNSFVSYWMPFNWSNCGIHDASWRGSFGGNIYYGSGSHGCVNAPYANAKIIYENIEEGTPVVVYNSSTQKI